MLPQDKSRIEARGKPTRDPCPEGDGELIHKYQTFKLYCDQDIVPSDIDRQPADNITQCLDLCSASRQKCFAVAFEAAQTQGIRNCYLKTLTDFVDKKGVIIDAAVLVSEPTPTSDCGKLEPTYSANDVEYEVLCGMDMPNDDIKRLPAETMAECMDACTEYGQEDGSKPCVGVAYESKRERAFFNCWLKSDYVEANLQNTKDSEEKQVDCAFLPEAMKAGTTTTIIDSITTTSGSSSTTTASNSNTVTSATIHDDVISPSHSNSSDGNHVSGGTIGGAVIGGVAGLAVIIGLGFYVLRRRRAKEKQSEGVSSMPAGEPKPDRRHELGAAQPPSELPGNTTYQ